MREAEANVEINRHGALGTISEMRPPRLEYPQASDWQ